jgi:hypothetical protein
MKPGETIRPSASMVFVAVPVIRFLYENDTDNSDQMHLFRDAVRMTKELHAQRAGLIEAANGVFAIQRVVVL